MLSMYRDLLRVGDISNTPLLQHGGYFYDVNKQSLFALLSYQDSQPRHIYQYTAKDSLHALDQFLCCNTILFIVIDPGKMVCFHKEDQEKFSNRSMISFRVWNTYYNNLEHCGLGGKTPNEFLEDTS